MLIDVRLSALTARAPNSENDRAYVKTELAADANTSSAMLSHKRCRNLFHGQVTVIGDTLQEAIDLDLARCDRTSPT